MRAAPAFLVVLAALLDVISVRGFITPQNVHHRISSRQHATQRGTTLKSYRRLNHTCRICRTVTRMSSEVEEKPADSEEEEEVIIKRAKTGTVNARLLNEINTVMPRSRNYAGMLKVNVEREEVNLNGVQPFMAFLGAIFAGGMSYAAWQLTVTLAGIYLVQSQKFADSDIIIVQRLTGFMKQVIVGLGTLGSGVFGVTALGMLLLAARVLQGVATGELDPNQMSPDVEKSNTIESKLEGAERLLAKAQAELEEGMRKPR